MSPARRSTAGLPNPDSLLGQLVHWLANVNCPNEIGGSEVHQNFLAVMDTLSDGELRSAYELGVAERLRAKGDRDAEASIRFLMGDFARGRPESLPWPDRLDPPGATANPEVLPLEAFPTGLRGWIESVAVSTQTPTDLAALLALAVLSAAVAGRIEVEITDAWREWVCLYVIAILPPGTRKSAVYGHLVKPLEEWELEVARESDPERLAAMDLVDMRKRALAAAKKAALKGGPQDDVRQARLRLEEAIAKVPPSTRLLIQDATPEVMLVVMEESGGRTALLAPEGDPLRIADGRYSGSGDARLGPLKQAWSGEQIRVDRVGRSAVYIRRPALTLGLTLQPGVIESLKNKGSFRGEGVFGRVLWGQPHHGLGSRLVGEAVPALDRDAERRFLSILSLLLRVSPASIEDGGSPVPHVMTLSDDAKSALYQFQAELEPQFTDGGRLAVVRDWGGKAAGQAIRIAALIELAFRAEVGQDLDGGVIRTKAMESGIKLMRALTTHALRVLGPANQQTHLLGYVLRRVLQLPEGSTVRDLHRACQGHSQIGGMDHLRELLDELAKRGCVRLREHRQPGPGRPPSPVVEINPALRGSMDRMDKNAAARPAGGRLVDDAASEGAFTNGGEGPGSKDRPIVALEAPSILGDGFPLFPEDARDVGHA